ncbi:uncharacterized protein TRIADDRAFT_54870 [Trichoplax adhaerens]|uniref:Biogenesis of lysosome-related organelles complex 1 subunit 1 n=1 Tax=Trichoplax adhaerens TaxID=10228 RepID=B3RT81_TRIAD|nr:hypothetical protein TRIADDRAFT_54870 [Trichoplax adhaerens]EDV27177.1 hypothetical protein TRIADDRAFT_54870 [Trichoplax adhaerens]|eukprot:XP_002111173.1 hypothetical protein TRIADDRAFT_54870 [Trichoplax adhaerens]
MLSNIVRKHQAKQAAAKEEQEKLKKEAMESCVAFGNALVDKMNTGVATAYQNQKKLDQELKQLQIHTAEYSKVASQWMGLVDGFNQSLKEIGDVENWAKTIENDMQVVCKSLEFAYKGSNEPIDVPSSS